VVKTSRSRATSADVARLAGVSRATVSYVLNDAPDQHISEATRVRVREAADSLGYHPHAGARALRKGRSDVVLTALPALPLGHAITTIMESTAHALSQRDLVCVAAPGRGLVDTDTVRAWLRMSPAAVVLLTDGIAPEALRLLEQADVEIVEPFADGGPQDISTFDGFQYAIGQVQAEYLLAAGHRRLVFADADSSDLQRLRDLRLAAIRDACAAAGAPAPRVCRVPLEAAAARAAVADCVLAGGDERATAVCAYNDEVALVVVSAVYAQGLAVPRDLAVVGVDDIPVAAGMSPPLSSVTWPVKEFGTAIAEVVARRLGMAEGEPSEAPEPLLIPHVVVRATT
jgi:DNA-binding LacI/PurR family transcriptional regulator